MNESVMPPERLKFVISVGDSFSAMKSRMSGWSIGRMPIFAPRLVPPCLMTSVERLKRRMKEIGPEATLLDDASRSL